MIAQSPRQSLNLLGRTPAIALLLAAAITALSGCSDKAPEHQAGTANDGEEITGEWQRIEPTPTGIHSWFPGTVTASRQVPVASRLSGFVRELAVDEGDTVERGDTLLVIDPASLDSRISQAEANLSKARSALENAREEHARFERLFQKDAIPERQFEQVELGLAAARGDFEAAKAAVEQARSEIDYSRIEAPFDGTITDRRVEPGQLANPGQPLLILQGTEAREIRLEVDDTAFAAMSPGASTRVEYRDAKGVDRHFNADVVTAISAADPVTRTHTVKLAVPESVEINPGQFVSVRVTLDEREAIVLPLEALHRRGGIDGVFVLDEQDRARFRAVRPGRETGKEVTILSGLVAGDRVVIEADGHLANGVTVRSGESS